ncbi:MAG: hypothetical protein E7813_15095 [Bradyrhizobium sp.]|nr:MAG: hypothetical protein E7813_15095 [Bradyrhizobium sp.]
MATRRSNAARRAMPRWQNHLFIALSRSANDATDYFQIPHASHNLSVIKARSKELMHFRMTRAQNQGRLCFKRRTISRLALLFVAVKH